jgi:DNA-directed RNA polymerase III subunit RPC2
MTKCRYGKVYIGMPYRQENDDRVSKKEITPNECRLRDLNYVAPISVDIKYVRGKNIISRPKVHIGELPVMLRSSRCRLAGKNDREMASMSECALDPGGYFIIKGTEKVILVQEQLSKNRVIVESDVKKNIFSASVTRYSSRNLALNTYTNLPRQFITRAQIEELCHDEEGTNNSLA